MKITLADIEVLRKEKNAGALVAQMEFLAKANITNSKLLLEYHDALLFHKAFPTDKNILSTAISSLAKIAETLAHVKPSFLEKLSLSGLPKTDILCNFSFTLANKLANYFPGKLYYHSDECSIETARNIMQALLPGVDYQNASQGELKLKARIKAISGHTKDDSIIKWLLGIFDASNLPLDIKEELYRQMKVYIRWQLGNDNFNRSTLQFNTTKIFYHKDFIRQVDSAKVLRTKIREPEKITLLHKELLAKTMQCSLAFLNRETDPVTYCDTNEIEFFDMGRGLQIALVGMQKEKRLALESYVGYMAFKNGVPASYGGGWMWGERCKIGVNIYSAFRGGESAWLFCQIMRLYYQHFNIRHFIVKPYQFGKGNPEGLQSGAFWFYYKLGFRPMDDSLKQLADGEMQKIKSDKNYRTTLQTLKKFTESNIEWKLAPKTVPYYDAGLLSEKISHYINTKFDGNRTAAIKTCTQKLQGLLPKNSISHANETDKTIFTNWALLAGMIEVEKLSKKEINAIARLISLKQGGKERNYIVALQKNNILMELK